jgi:hypothetical protein
MFLGPWEAHCQDHSRTERAAHMLIDANSRQSAVHPGCATLALGGLRPLT